MSFTTIKNGVDSRLIIIRHDESGFYNIAKTAKLVHSLKTEENSPRYHKGDNSSRGPLVAGWFRNQATQATISHLKLKYKIDEPYLIISTGPIKFRGTYVHPSLHIMFMTWLNPLYGMDSYMILSDLLLAQGEVVVDESQSEHSLCTLCGTGLAVSRYDKMCSRCWEFTFPKQTQQANFRTKEQSFMVGLLDEYPDIILNKKIKGGCSKRRPDGFLDVISHVVIIEVDENQHKRYDQSCENRRVMELSEDVAHRPVVFVRINPDGYDKDGTRLEGAFALTREGIPIKRVAEFDLRIQTLKRAVSDAISTVPTRTITTVELFFDC
jgi:hypothetical protein